MSSALKQNTDVNRTLGHTALHYGKVEDGPLAARVLELLGFKLTQHFPLAAKNAASPALSKREPS